MLERRCNGSLTVEEGVRTAKRLLNVTSSDGDGTTDPIELCVGSLVGDRRSSTVALLAGDGF